MRHTPERFAILDKVLGLPRHFKAGDVVEAMATDKYSPRQATIYSTLNLLVEANVLRRLSLEGQPVRYEVCDKSMKYIHLICESCGKIKEVNDPNFVAVMRARTFPAFTTDYYTLNVYGICNTCARKLRKVRSKSR